MLNPFSRRRRQPTSDPARVVDLAAWNDRGSSPTTTIARPDSLSPIDHTLPAIDPNITDARFTVERFVDDLATHGALDHGTGDALDYWIDDQLAEWKTVVDAQAEDRRKTMARLLSQHVENLQSAAVVLDELRISLDSTDRTVAHWRDQLNGHPAALPPRSLTWPGDAEKSSTLHATPTLPPGHLAQLLNPDPNQGPNPVILHPVHNRGRGGVDVGNGDPDLKEPS